MAKVHIYSPGLNQGEIDAVFQLLESASVASSDIEIVHAVGPASDACEQEVFIFLLSADALDNGVLDGEIAKVPDGGRRAICVWPENAGAGTPPPTAAKFSYSIVSWNAETLRTALADDDVTCFESPTGEPLPAEDTERLECP